MLVVVGSVVDLAVVVVFGVIELAFGDVTIGLAVVIDTFASLEDPLVVATTSGEAATSVTKYGKLIVALIITLLGFGSTVSIRCFWQSTVVAVGELTWPDVSNWVSVARSPSPASPMSNW